MTFLISAQKHRLWILVRTASSSKMYVLSRNIKFQNFYMKTFSFFLVLRVKFSIYLKSHFFVMKRAHNNLQAYSET